MRNTTAIPGAIGVTYTLTLSDAGQTIAAQVTPLAQTGTNPGLPVLSNSVAVQPANVVLNVSAGLKQLHFSWAAVPGASNYKVSYSPAEGAGFVLLSAASENLTATTFDWDISVHRINWPKAQFLLEACDASNFCLPSANVSAVSVMLGTIGYFKASNTGTYDYFGYALALSADGNTLAVGAHSENSAATGVGGNQTDACPATNCAVYSGAVYVYTRTNGNWSPQPVYIKASNTGAFDHFGYALALSANGNTLAVGAYTENSAATGVGGNQVYTCPATNCAQESGAVYVYTRTNGNWSPQPTYVKASNTGAYDRFGSAVALSADGNTLAVGAYEEDSAATGVGSTQTDACPATNCAYASGAVYVYTRTNSSWSPQLTDITYVKASNTGAGDRFGSALALSADGNTLAVGAPQENSAATGVGSTQANACPAVNCAKESGAVYVYTRVNGNWLPQLTDITYIKASNTGTGDRFGSALALSADGNALAVGAFWEDSAATGVGGNQADACPATNCATDSGAVYVYTRTNGSWSPQLTDITYVKASNTGAGDRFGSALALSANGNTLVVGAPEENSAATGVGGNQADACPATNCAAYSGAVYVYTRVNGNWLPQLTYIKASNTGAYDIFGRALTLSADGNTLAVGAYGEDSAATGLNNTVPGQSDNSVFEAGAVYLY